VLYARETWVLTGDFESKILDLERECYFCSVVCSNFVVVHKNSTAKDSVDFVIEHGLVYLFLFLLHTFVCLSC